MPRIKQTSAVVRNRHTLFCKDRCSKNPYTVFACSAVPTSTHLNKKTLAQAALPQFFLRSFLNTAFQLLHFQAFGESPPTTGIFLSAETTVLPKKKASPFSYKEPLFMHKLSYTYAVEVILQCPRFKKTSPTLNWPQLTLNWHQPLRERGCRSSEKGF